MPVYQSPVGVLVSQTMRSMKCHVTCLFLILAVHTLLEPAFARLEAQSLSPWADLGNGWRSTWMGPVYTEFDPWVYHAEHGWMYLHGAADSLASIFSPVVGATRSWVWGKHGQGDNFSVIVDNMMNLELLLWSARNDPEIRAEYETMAITHADTTIRDFIRPDGGTWHVIIYNRNDGSILSRETHQGYSNSSTWSSSPWRVRAENRDGIGACDHTGPVRALIPGHNFLNLLNDRSSVGCSSRPGATAGRPSSRCACHLCTADRVEIG